MPPKKTTGKSSKPPPSKKGGRTRDDAINLDSDDGNREGNNKTRKKSIFEDDLVDVPPSSAREGKETSANSDTGSEKGSTRSDEPEEPVREAHYSQDSPEHPIWEAAQLPQILKLHCYKGVWIQVIRGVEGYITQIDADAIVTATNSALEGPDGEDIDESIYKAAGGMVIQELSARYGKKNVRMSDAFATGPGNIKSTYAIIHTVVPKFDYYSDDEHEEFEDKFLYFQDSYISAVREARKKRPTEERSGRLSDPPGLARKVAFGYLGLGKFDRPTYMLLPRHAMEGVKRYIDKAKRSEEHWKTHPLTHVTFIVKNIDDAKVYFRDLMAIFKERRPANFRIQNMDDPMGYEDPFNHRKPTPKELFVRLSASHDDKERERLGQEIENAFNEVIDGLNEQKKLSEQLIAEIQKGRQERENLAQRLDVLEKELTNRGPRKGSRESPGPGGKKRGHDEVEVEDDEPEGGPSSEPPSKICKKNDHQPQPSGQTEGKRPGKKPSTAKDKTRETPAPILDPVIEDLEGSDDDYASSRGDTDPEYWPNRPPRLKPNARMKRIGLVCCNQNLNGKRCPQSRHHRAGDRDCFIHDRVKDKSKLTRKLKGTRKGMNKVRAR